MTVVSCCGGVQVDERDPGIPDLIKRCVKRWDSPCTTSTSRNCCEGTDKCISSSDGGKCFRSDKTGYYIYEDGVKMEYHEDMDLFNFSKFFKIDRDYIKKYVKTFVAFLCVLAILFFIYKKIKNKKIGIKKPSMDRFQARARFSNRY